MVSINLARIHFRPYSEGEEPTTFGPDEYNMTEGTIDLSTIKFRPWEDPILTSIGGSGEGEGGGGGPGEGDQGDVAVLIDGTTVDEFAYKTITPATAIYVKADFYIPGESFTNLLIRQFSADILEISEAGDPDFAWQGLFTTNRNSSNVQDGNLYLWDYYTPASGKIQILQNTWYTIELGARYTGTGDDWEISFRVNGLQTSPGWTVEPFPGVANLDTIVVGANYADSTFQSGWYLDNVEISVVDWPLSGGTVIFEDDFEDGSFSAWTGTVGPIGTGSPP